MKVKKHFKVVLIMKYLSMIVLLFFILSCSSEKEDSNTVIKIDIEDKHNANLNLPNLNIESIVPLETNDSALFGFISGIEYFSDRLYVLDVFSSKSVMAFSKTGKFLNKTTIGRGPEEVINPFAISIDRNKKNILVYDQTSGSICLYDLELNYLSKKKYSGVPLLDFAKIDNNLLVRSHYNQDYSYTLYAPDYESIKGQFVKDYKYSGVQGILRSISITDKQILLLSSFDYNIYKLIDGGIYNEYYVDFGKHKITKNDIKKYDVETFNLKNKVTAPHEIAQSDNFLLFHVYYNREPIHYIYSFDNNNTYRLNDYFENGILPKCKIRGVVEKDTFYALVDPIEMIEFQEKTNQKLIEEKIDIQQNPFLLTFSLSEL